MDKVAVCCEASMEYMKCKVLMLQQVVHMGSFILPNYKKACASNLFMSWLSALQQFVEMSAIL
jgi:hypothetical protein